MSTKPQLRRAVRQRLASMTPQQHRAGSDAVAVHLLDLPEVRGASAIFTYVSNAVEVDTHRLIARWLAEARTVAVPMVGEAGTISAHRIGALDALQPGRFGILAPAAPDPLTQDPDVCIVPAIAATRQGHRLGRAGGYYDRYLAEHPRPVSVALIFEEQLVTSIPTEPHDRAVDIVVTPSELIRC